MDKKTKAFEKLCFDAYKNKDQYEKLVHRMKRARTIMMKSHTSFCKFSAAQQFHYCITISLIATHTTHQNLRRLKVLSNPPKEIFEYSIEEYFEPIITIDQKKEKLLGS